MHRWKARSGPILGSAFSIALLAAGLSGCAPPGYRFEASDAHDIVIKVPRSWSLVRSGVPANSDGTPGAAGN